MSRLAAVFVMIPAAAMAQSGPSQADMDAINRGTLLLDKGRYLDAAETLRPFAFDAQGQPKKGFVYQQWVEARTLMNGEPAEPMVEPSDDPKAKADARRVAAAEPRDAIREIVARAARTRVVILNENHGLPQNRAFALRVARALRPLGYSVLAAETFTNRDPAAMTRLAKTGYPTLSTGYYSHDPVFGDFVRQALALGYRPLSYEHISDGQTANRAEGIARREEGQANNLARALAADPKARFFVYVGYSHVTEQPIDGPDDSKAAWMATRLKAKTGIDPLTIDQTTLGGRTRYVARIKESLAGRIGAQSIALFEGDRPLVIGNYAGAVDMQVAHPAAKMVKGRPDWLAVMNRGAMAVPAGFLPQKGERLVQAFIATESDDAVPVDQVLVRAGEEPPVLMVPAGKPLRFVMQEAMAVKP